MVPHSLIYLGHIMNSFAVEKNDINNQSVANELQRALSSTYALYFITHNYHWNVEGARFVSLHTFFEEQYTELFSAIDLIAERIRALGFYARSYQDDQFFNNINKLDEPQNNDAESASNQMIQNLISLNIEVINACQVAKSAAGEVNDDETEDMMIERITIHQKVIWMLQSIIK